MNFNFLLISSYCPIRSLNYQSLFAFIDCLLNKIVVIFSYILSCCLRFDTFKCIETCLPYAIFFFSHFPVFSCKILAVPEILHSFSFLCLFFLDFLSYYLSQCLISSQLISSWCSVCSKALYLFLNSTSNLSVSR